MQKYNDPSEFIKLVSDFDCLKKYNVIREIHKGTYSLVLKIQHIETNVECVTKIQLGEVIGDSINTSEYIDKPLIPIEKVIEFQKLNLDISPKIIEYSFILVKHSEKTTLKYYAYVMEYIPYNCYLGLLENVFDEYTGYSNDVIDAIYESMDFIICTLQSRNIIHCDLAFRNMMVASKIKCNRITSDDIMNIFQNKKRENKISFDFKVVDFEDSFYSEEFYPEIYIVNLIHDLNIFNKTMKRQCCLPYAIRNIEKLIYKYHDLLTENRKEEYLQHICEFFKINLCSIIIKDPHSLLNYTRICELYSKRQYKEFLSEMLKIENVKMIKFEFKFPKWFSTIPNYSECWNIK
jgi:serine/threonine protein kinase